MITPVTVSVKKELPAIRKFMALGDYTVLINPPFDWENAIMTGNVLFLDMVIIKDSTRKIESMIQGRELTQFLRYNKAYCHLTAHSMATGINMLYILDKLRDSNILPADSHTAISCDDMIEELDEMRIVILYMP